MFPLFAVPFFRALVSGIGDKSSRIHRLQLIFRRWWSPLFNLDPAV